MDFDRYTIRAVDEATWPDILGSGFRSQPPATVHCDSGCLAHLAELDLGVVGHLGRPRLSLIRPANERDTSRYDGNRRDANFAGQWPDSSITAGSEGTLTTLKVETRVRTPLGLLR